MAKARAAVVLLLDGAIIPIGIVMYVAAFRMGGAKSLLVTVVCFVLALASFLWARHLSGERERDPWAVSRSDEPNGWEKRLNRKERRTDRSE